MPNPTLAEVLAAIDDCHNQGYTIGSGLRAIQYILAHRAELERMELERAARKAVGAELGPADRMTEVMQDTVRDDGSVERFVRGDDLFSNRLERNVAQCLKCYKILESKHRHDFRTCECGNLSVDGGKAYPRRLWRASDRSWKELSYDYTPEVKP